MDVVLMSPAVVTASASTRTIAGTAALYGVVASASMGPMVIEAGALHLSEQLSRVKLLVDHDQAQPVGYAATADDDAERLAMTFTVPAGPAGDIALQQAANGLRDGLSIGAWIDDDGYTFDEHDVLHVASAQLREVSLCAVPAYDDARVTDVAATAAAWRAARAADQRGSTMPAPVIEAAPVTASTPEPTTTVAAQPEPTATVVVANQAAPVVPPRTTSRTMTLAQVADLTLAAIRSGQPGMVQATLADIVPADDAGGVDRPQWIDELWQASTQERPLIDALGTPTPLTALKVMGYKRVWTQLVDEYAGNKGPIFSGEYKTEPAEAPAQRYAGGNDIDRAFFDLGSGAFIASWFTAATDDYKRQTETAVTATLLTAATVVAGQTTVIGSINRIASNLKVIGASLDFTVLSELAWDDLSTLTTAEAPWWLAGSTLNIKGQDGTVSTVAYTVSPALTGLQVLGGDSRSATFYEKQPPVQVRAENVANGGIDVGVFGYIATIVNDARALQKATYVPPVADEPAAGRAGRKS